jgi:hypothetical protein
MQTVQRCRWIYRRTTAPLFFETLERRWFFSASDQLSSDQQYQAYALASLDVNMNLFQFTGAQPADGFQTDIDWGDGTDTAGTIVSNGADNWTLQGQHHYDTAGVYDVTFTVATSDGENDGFGSWTTLAVGSDGIVPTDTDQQVYADETTGTEGLVSFMDAGMTDDAQYRASIDWGDGRVTDGVVDTSQGQGVVSGDVEYTTSGTHNATVTIQRLGADGQLQTQTSIPVSIDFEFTPIYLSAPGDWRTITYAADGHTSGTFATFSSDQPIDNFSGQIDWGDGTTSSATITATGQLDDEGSPIYAVSGDHQYAPGDNDYSMEIDLQSTVGNQGSFDEQVSVGSDRLVAQPISSDPSQPLLWVNSPNYMFDSGFNLGSVTDPAAPSDAQYNVSVDWGDGTTSAGGAYAFGNNVSIEGQHSYAANGTYAVSVTVSRPSVDGDSTVSTSYNFSLQLIDPSEIDAYEQQGQWIDNIGWADGVRPLPMIGTEVPGTALIAAPTPSPIPTPTPVDSPQPLMDSIPTPPANSPIAPHESVAAAPVSQLFTSSAPTVSLQTLLADDHQHDLLTPSTSDLL